MLSRKVVIYGMNYAPEVAGVGRYTGQLAEYLAASGHDVCVITTPPHYPGWKVKAPYKSLNWTKEVLAGAIVYRCPVKVRTRMMGVHRVVAPLSFAFSSAPVAFWQILKRRPDVVIAIEPTLLVAPIGLIAAKLVAAKSILHLQDLEVDAAFAVGHLADGGIVRRIAEAFEKLMLSHFAQIITISQRMAERVILKGVLPSRIEIIRNWVDLALIRPLGPQVNYRHDLGIPEKAFVVLYSGNIGAKQGLPLLVEAARLLANHQDILFVVAGDGPMRLELDLAAESLKNLRVLDFQPEVRFCEFLAIADLHVLPQEGSAADLLLPSKLGGMLASGRRIIVTADPDTELSDFLGTSCSFSRPNDAGALAAGILKLASEVPCPHQEAARLQRAQLLDKEKALAAFVAKALHGGIGDAALDSTANICN